LNTKKEGNVRRKEKGTEGIQTVRIEDEGDGDVSRRLGTKLQFLWSVQLNEVLAG
jgi:hypothetical protein